MKRAVASFILCFALSASSSALAADNGEEPILDEEACEQIWYAYYKAYDKILELQGCTTIECNSLRLKYVSIMAKTSRLWSEAGCEAYALPPGSQTLPPPTDGFYPSPGSPTLPPPTDVFRP